MTYAEFIDEWNNESDVIECVTSGSTGERKHISLPKKEVFRSARRTLSHLHLLPGSLFYSCISPDFIGGKMMAVRALISNGHLRYETPSNRPLNTHDGTPIDLLAVVPSQMHHILDNLDKLPYLRYILIGGSPIPPQLRKRIADSGLSAWETYGMTETASHIAMRKITEQPLPFYPLPGIKIEKNQDGCLSIEIEGWQKLDTNDLVEITDDGGFNVTGRKDCVIISGGKKVNPLEIENILEQEFGVDILVGYRIDEKWGQKIIYVIETAPDSSLEKKIREFCAKHLNPEARSKEIIFGRIPRTLNGKKDRGSKI